MSNTSFEELGKLSTELDAKIKAEGAKALKEYFKVKFAENPDILAARITGYVPGFNDGDPCTFSLEDVMFKVAGHDGSYSEEDEDEDDDSIVRWCDVWDLRDNPVRVSVEDINNTIGGYWEILNKAFGDNFRITVTPEKIVVDDYDCGF